MRYRALLVAVVLAALPVVASAQYGPGVPRSPSIVRQAGAWDNYMYVPDGHCGCAMPVRCNNYANCCHTCGIHPVCWLKRMGRMLDCLLPCNLCGCGGGPFGCHCGSCGSCSSYGGAEYSPGCPTCGAPGLTDPFQDDPPAASPAPPTPEPAHDVRMQPKRKLPQSIARDPRPSSQARATLPGATARDRQEQAFGISRRSPAIAAGAASQDKSAERSVLRRTSLEEEVIEPAELAVDTEEASPISTARAAGTAMTPIVGSDNYQAGVPNNPLRSRR
jgi:hypothetical protein